MNVDTWVLECARDMATELEIPVPEITMEPEYDGAAAVTSFWFGNLWQVRFSRPFWEANLGNDDLLTDLVLHEMAHAMLPAEAGHNKEWRTLARSLGSRGDQFICYGNHPQNLRYRGECKACGWSITVSRDDVPGALWICGNGECTGRYRLIDTLA
jgi:predicted SprT family Zn-dependent metalloprotease